MPFIESPKERSYSIPNKIRPVPEPVHAEEDNSDISETELNDEEYEGDEESEIADDDEQDDNEQVVDKEKDKKDDEAKKEAKALARARRSFERRLQKKGLVLQHDSVIAEKVSLFCSY